MMKKNLFNIMVDCFSLLAFGTMISTGLLLKFILPPGSGRVERLYGGGPWREKSIDTLFSLTRHEWGEIHLYIALLFLVLLVIHLFLHWKWIHANFFGTIESPRSIVRKMIFWIILGILFLSISAPWMVQKKSVSKTQFLNLREGVSTFKNS